MFVYHKKFLTLGYGYMSPVFDDIVRIINKASGVGYDSYEYKSLIVISDNL